MSGPPCRVTSPRYTSRDANVASAFAAAVETRGDAPAVFEADGVTSYAALLRRSARIAAALGEAGVGGGDRVAVWLPRGADAAAAYFGVLATGAVAVLVNETLRTRQLERILADADVRVTLASGELRSLLARPLPSRHPVLDVAELGTEHGNAPFLPLRRGADELAQIIYTSGSTGLPKGVMLSHGNLLAATRTVIGYLGIDREDRIASLLPFSFSYGLSQLLCAIGAGASLVIPRSPLATDIVTTLRDLRVTVVAAVPPLWTQLLDVRAFRERPLADLRILTNAGGRLPVRHVRVLRESYPRAKLFLMYGLTEVLRSTCLSPEEVDAHPDSIGRAVPGAEVIVVRDDGTECGPGEPGQLVHRGPTVALGYWNDPEATARVFRAWPRDAGETAARAVFSGDIVRLDAEGRLHFVGRADQQIKTLGYRVSPEEVCEALYDSGEVREAAVSGEDDEQRGSRIVAWVALRDGGSLERLRAFCARELPRYMLPARYEVRDSLPRSPAGKFDVRGGAPPAV